MTGGLFVRIANFDQRRLTPGPAEYLKARRKAPVDKAHWDGNGGKAGGRRDQRAVVAVRGVEVTDKPGRVVPLGIDKNVHLAFVHYFQHALRQTLTVLGCLLAAR